MGTCSSVPAGRLWSIAPATCCDRRRGPSEAAGGRAAALRARSSSCRPSRRASCRATPRRPPPGRGTNGPGRGSSWRPLSSPRRAHAANFLDCVRSRKRPVCDVEVGFYSTLPCLLGLLAIRERRPYTWDAANMKAKPAEARNCRAPRSAAQMGGRLDSGCPVAPADTRRLDPQVRPSARSARLLLLPGRRATGPDRQVTGPSHDQGGTDQHAI